MKTTYFADNYNTEELKVMAQELSRSVIDDVSSGNIQCGYYAADVLNEVMETLAELSETEDQR